MVHSVVAVVRPHVAYSVLFYPDVLVPPPPTQQFSLWHVTLSIVSRSDSSLSLYPTYPPLSEVIWLTYLYTPVHLVGHLLTVWSAIEPWRTSIGPSYKSSIVPRIPTDDLTSPFFLFRSPCSVLPPDAMSFSVLPCLSIFVLCLASFRGGVVFAGKCWSFFNDFSQCHEIAML